MATLYDFRPNRLSSRFRVSAWPRSLARRAIALVHALKAWHERRRQLDHAMSLDDRLLRDIGLTRAMLEEDYRRSPLDLLRRM